jgi:hypothetical protein
MKSRHIGISDSIGAALGNVNLYTLMGENPQPALEQLVGQCADDDIDF